jgi:hypothetical protein
MTRLRKLELVTLLGTALLAVVEKYISQAHTRL